MAQANVGRQRVEDCWVILRLNALNSLLSSFQNQRSKGGKYAHCPGWPKVLLRHWCVTLLRMLISPLNRPTAQYCPSLVHEQDIARETILLFDMPFWSTSHNPIKYTDKPDH